VKLSSYLETKADRDQNLGELMKYNVFLCHNSKEKAAVQQIADALKSYGLTYWLDDSEIVPGRPVLDAIEAGLLGSKSVAVFIGPDSMGQWQKQESRIAVAQAITRNIPVIPVFLPGVPQQIRNELAPALQTFHWVDFSKGIEDEKALSRLRWGITGEKPKEAAPVLARPPEQAARRDPVNNAIQDMVETLWSQNLTFFIGPGASYSNPPARTCDITRELLRELNIIQDDYQWLLPPIDIAGLYYSGRYSDQRLEDRIVNMLQNFPQDISGTQDSLARLLKLLATRPKRRIRGNPRPQLIVTTNLDLMTERALLRAGLPFSRIVQHRSGDQISVNEYKDIKLADDDVLEYPGPGGQERLSLTDPIALDEFIQRHGARTIRNKENLGTDDNALHTLPLHQLTEPILYKSLGSQEMQNSCVLSSAHHYDFARNVLRRSCIPAQITEIIGNSMILFIGLSFMDPDFRLTYNTLLTNALDDINRSDRGYAIQLPPESYQDDDIYRHMESGLWENIKDYGRGRLGIKTIEEQSDMFLNRLYSAVETDITNKNYEHSPSVSN
jgi:hypothetical protein